MQRFLTFYIASFLSVFFLMNCATVSTNSDYDNTADFNSYKTYNFHKKGIEKLKVNSLDKNRMIKAIEQQLEAKGLVKAENPDLTVNILTSSKEEIDVDVNPYYNPWWGPSTSTRQYTSGTIIIDLVDEKRNILVWQGKGSGLNLSNLEKKSERIPNAIQEILEDYPPNGKKEK